MTFMMNKPMAIWLLEPNRRNLRIRASTGLTHSYTVEALAVINDGSVISQVVQTGKEQFIRDIYGDDRFRYPAHARKAGWASMLGFPIKVRGQTSGVIEIFTLEPHDFTLAELDTLRRLADLTCVAIEKDYHLG